MKILIVYGTRFGMTRLTAETMAARLRDNYSHSVTVTTYKLEKSLCKQINEFDLLIVGSSIVSGMWKSGVKRFLKKYARNKRVALFVSAGGTLNRALKDGRPQSEGVATAIQRYIQPVVEKYGLEPIKLGAFGGQSGKGDKIKYSNWSKEDIILWVDELSKTLNSIVETNREAKSLE